MRDTYQTTHLGFLIEGISHNFFLGHFKTGGDKLVIYLFLHEGPGASDTNLTAVSK